jgi:hypothetical protein
LTILGFVRTVEARMRIGDVMEHGMDLQILSGLEGGRASRAHIGELGSQFGCLRVLWGVHLLLLSCSRNQTIAGITSLLLLDCVSIEMVQESRPRG